MLVELLEGVYEHPKQPQRAIWESTVIPNCAHLQQRHKAQTVNGTKTRVPETSMSVKHDVFLLSGLEAVRFMVPDQNHKECERYWLPLDSDLTPWDEVFTAADDDCADMLNTPFYGEYQLQQEVRMEQAKEKKQNEGDNEEESSSMDEQHDDEEEEDDDEDEDYLQTVDSKADEMLAAMFSA